MDTYIKQCGCLQNTHKDAYNNILLKSQREGRRNITIRSNVDKLYSTQNPSSIFLSPPPPTKKKEMKKKEKGRKTETLVLYYVRH